MKIRDISSLHGINILDKNTNVIVKYNITIMVYARYCSRKFIITLPVYLFYSLA